MLRNKKFYLILVVLFLTGLVTYYKSLPGLIQEREGVTQRLLITDRNGKNVRSYSKGESFDWVPIEEIPQELIELIILAEDRNFYSHQGIDISSALRSLWLNVRSFRIVSGASTITQQVYRQGHSVSRDSSGKLRTLLGAIKIEKKYNKKEILESYLNTLPYANQILGVKRAGEIFFGKDIHLLSLSEYATLAVLPRSPAGLRRRPEELIKRRNALLREFGTLKKLDAVDVEIAMKLPLEFHHDLSGWDNYHFAENLFTQPDFKNHISGDGRVETVLDLDLQKETSEILRSHLKGLEKFNVGHGAAVVLQNDTGDVLAYVGSQSIQNKNGGHYDALKLRRQPGSALKPLTFALALQKGKKLSDVLPDIPSYYKTGLGQFLPRNYDQSFSGPRLMREALANSLNLPAVALADEVGVTEVHTFYKAMGLSLPKEAHHYGVGMTLGNIEITPFELAEAYTAFARKGERIRARFFQNSSIKTESTPLTSETAYLISDVLADTVARREEFGENNPFDFPFAFSVKTGTSTDFRDNWVVGYNKDYTIVVWVGNTDQRPMKRVSGITGAGPVLKDIVRYLSKRRLMKPIERLGSVESHKICSLSGMAPDVHCSHKKNELFVKGTFTGEKCKWHHEVLVKDCRYPSDEQKVKVAFLPDAYQAWVSERPEWSVENQINEMCPFDEKKYNKISMVSQMATIISKPLSGSIFAIDPNIPRRLQKLKLELNRFHEVKTVKWKLNGKEVEIGSSSLSWPMEKGDHVFEAEVLYENGKTDRTPVIGVKIL